MKRIFPLAVVIFLLGLCFPGLALAQGSGGVQLESRAEIEIEAINADGEKEIQRLAASRVVPGDEVIYTTGYNNAGSEPASNIVITNPIPEHMLFTQDSATGEGTTIEFSVDGGQTYDLRENLRVPTPDGGERRAVSGDFTHIRWTLEKPLGSGEAGEVSYRAVLQ